MSGSISIPKQDTNRAPQDTNRAPKDTSQAGRRPAIVVSPFLYNEKTGLALFCPITSQVKGYPFEISLPKEHEIQGVILADQIKCLDWKAKNAQYICKAESKIVDQLISKLATLIVN